VFIIRKLFEKINEFHNGLRVSNFCTTEVRTNEQTQAETI